MMVNFKLDDHVRILRGNYDMREGILCDIGEANHRVHIDGTQVRWWVPKERLVLAPLNALQQRLPEGIKL